MNRTDQMATLPPAGPRLTAESRRAVCFHEAGHAVLFALGGAFVYRVAVAPEGATDWRTTSRKGREMADLWGVCSPSDPPHGMCTHWDESEGAFTADKAFWLHMLRMQEERVPGAKAEQLRQVRAHVVGCLGGPAAEAIFLGEEPQLTEGECGVPDDLAMVEAACWLLPWRDEREHLEAIALQALRRPDVWAYVARLADELERRGDIEEGIDGLLPAPLKGWPASPRVKRQPAYDIRPLSLRE